MSQTTASPSLFDFIKAAAARHAGVDVSWTSPELEERLNDPGCTKPVVLGDADADFHLELYFHLRERSLTEPEVQRLYLVAIECGAACVMKWLHRVVEKKGAWAYRMVEEMLVRHGWTEEDLADFFDRLLMRGTEAQEKHLAEHLLTWPDRRFVRRFSAEKGPRARALAPFTDYRWMSLFVNSGEKDRLLAILLQIRPEERGRLDAGAYTFLLNRDPAMFADAARAAAGAYEDGRSLRSAYETCRRLSQQQPEKHRTALMEITLQILASDDGDTQLHDAAKDLIPLAGVEAMPSLLSWYQRAPVKGPGPWIMAPGGGKGTVLYFAAAHIGPEALPLLEAALAHNDIGLSLQCLGCWAQYRHAPTRSLLQSWFGRIISDCGTDVKQRIAALEAAVRWDADAMEPVLIQVLEDSNQGLRSLAARALGFQGGKHLDLAINMLASRKAPARSAAVTMLDAMGDEVSLTHLEAALAGEKNAAVADEMCNALHSLAAGLHLSLSPAAAGRIPAKKRPALIPRFKADKAPALTRPGGAPVSEAELHFLTLRQRRAGETRLAEEWCQLLDLVPPSEQDRLACHLVDRLLGQLEEVAWLMPLIGRLCGAETLSLLQQIDANYFSSREVLPALGIIRVLNNHRTPEVEKFLEMRRRHYPWFSRLPWPGFDQGDLFESAFEDQAAE